MTQPGSKTNERMSHQNIRQWGLKVALFNLAAIAIYWAIAPLMMSLWPLSFSALINPVAKILLVLFAIAQLIYLVVLYIRLRHRRNQSERANFVAGILTVIFSHVALAAIFLVVNLVIYPLTGSYNLSMTAYFGSWFAIALIGLTQIIYVLPLWLWLKHKGRSDTAEGITAGAILTALLDGSFVFVYLAIASIVMK